MGMLKIECNGDDDVDVDVKDLMNFLSDYYVINETIERNITSKYIDCNFGVGMDGTWYIHLNHPVPIGVTHRTFYSTL